MNKEMTMAPRPTKQTQAVVIELCVSGDPLFPEPREFYSVLPFVYSLLPKCRPRVVDREGIQVLPNIAGRSCSEA